eukprot:354691-Chlamydomonas_euryale.AAC.19
MTITEDRLLQNRSNGCNHARGAGLAGQLRRSGRSICTYACEPWLAKTVARRHRQLSRGLWPRRPTAPHAGARPAIVPWMVHDGARWPPKGGAGVKSAAADGRLPPSSPSTGTSPQLIISESALAYLAAHNLTLRCRRGCISSAEWVRPREAAASHSNATNVCRMADCILQPAAVVAKFGFKASCACHAMLPSTCWRKRCEWILSAQMEVTTSWELKCPMSQKHLAG